MKTIKITLAAIMMVGIVSISWAQRPYKNRNKGQETDTRVLVIGVSDPSVEELVELKAYEFYKSNHVDGFQEAKMPRFIISDKRANAVFAIGGFVQFRTAYDFNNVIGNTDFVTYDMPMMTTPSNQERLLMDASVSRLFFKTLVKTRPLGTIEAYIETDFRGGDNVLRLRKAYVSFLGLTIGQNTSLMTDINSSFNTIDFEGPNAYTYLRNLGVQYRRSLGSGFSMGVGLEYPVLSATNGDNAYIIPQRIPDVPLYFQYAWNKSNSHVRLSALMRNMFYHNDATNESIDLVGYGMQFSTSIKIAPQVSFYGNAIYGKGIGNYINDLEGNGVDLIPNRMENGNMIAPRTFAWLAGAQFNITKQLPVTIGYSQVRQYGENDYWNGNGYKMSQYIVANAFYNINRYFTVGVEYLYGTRYNFDDAFGRANRVQAMVQFNF